MAFLLRQLVASPRARHPEAGLDLCYVTQDIIATSGPGARYPQVAYRTPVKDLVKFLDSKHGVEWAIWEFRAEGTGYPDTEVYNRVQHFPWPDHHPPPFALIPLITASMRNWLKAEDAEGKGRVVVVHCKAGKGRSGTVACSYLISEEGWDAEEAKKRFTERRMRTGFGNGISIPSQVRWISYVDRWTKHGKVYMERSVEVLEVHVWGLRNGVKLAVEGYVEDGKKIKMFHTFQSSEREIVRGSIVENSGLADAALEVIGRGKKKETILQPSPVPLAQDTEKPAERKQDVLGRTDSDMLAGEKGGDVVYRPSSRVILPTNEINIDFERRSRSKYSGFAMVTSIAHVWFNTFFEGQGPEKEGKADESGVFEIEWDAMDGLKGSSRKGTRAFDRLAVLWRAVDSSDNEGGVLINQPAEGEKVEDTGPVNLQADDKYSQDFEKKLGLRAATTESAQVSRASSLKTGKEGSDESLDSTGPDESEGVKSHIPDD